MTPSEQSDNLQLEGNRIVPTGNRIVPTDPPCRPWLARFLDGFWGGYVCGVLGMAVGFILGGN